MLDCSDKECTVKDRLEQVETSLRNDFREVKEELIEWRREIRRGLGALVLVLIAALFGREIYHAAISASSNANAATVHSQREIHPVSPDNWSRARTDSVLRSAAPVGSILP